MVVEKNKISYCPKTLAHLNSITIFRSSIFNIDNKMVVEKNKIS